MEALQKELYKYFVDKIDAAIHKEIERQRRNGVKRNNDIWHIELLESDLELNRLIKTAVDNVVDDWVFNEFDLETYKSASGMYCIKAGRLV